MPALVSASVFKHDVPTVFNNFRSSQQHAQLQLSCSGIKGNISVSFNTNYMYTKPQEQMPLLVNLHESACRKFPILITIRGGGTSEAVTPSMSCYWPWPVETPKLIDVQFPIVIFVTESNSWAIQ